ncbi:MAG: pantoate--beta-alanine ligase [Bacteroidia bacterium]|nr:pantoate--beta-alanine ligase [Bacteroidia bacterium]
MLVIEKKNKLRNKLIQAKTIGKTIGFVPTMGALHSGHLSLIERAKKECDVVVCSIYVNPTQFNNAADFENYPQTLKADVNLLDLAKCDFVFTPTFDELYESKSDLLDIDLGNLERNMEGEYRPGHFLGMVTVVKKFFDIVEPDKGFFGEKDFQQLAIINYMVSFFQLPIEIIGCATVRENDGLALSSRNALLNKEQREAAPLIYKALCSLKELLLTHTVQECKDMVTEQINKNKELGVEYIEIVNSKTLQPITEYNTQKVCRACIAVYAGNIRLIDNIAL